ncbi:MAG TPA: SEC-C metal-binding domain-containing protein [Gemmataceae bacterium]|nr:SEC-C metal-binding domain-containing protein [Gemmataceae bacterium]
MSSYLDLLTHYKRRRSTSMAVNHALVERLSREVLDEGGKKLGILKGNTLLLDSEDELAVLMDFCIHDVRRDGHTAVESFLLEAPFASGSEEMLYLNALRQARYSLFVLERVERGCGIEVRDLRWGGTRFIMDIGLGSTGSPDLLLAARVIPFESVFVTTGAPLASGRMPNRWKKSPLHALLGRLSEEDVTRFTPQQISEQNATIIRTFLQAGAAEHTGYIAPEDCSDSPPRTPTLRQPARIGRNDPCPCGSGKKFKKCCGSHQ